MSLQKWMEMWEASKDSFPKSEKYEEPKPIEFEYDYNTALRYAGLPADKFLNEQMVNPAQDSAPNLSNPIHFTSVGKDQELRVTPNFSDGEELVELHNVKIALEQLESKLNAAEGLGQKTGSIIKQLDSLREKFEKLSHLIQPDPTVDQS